MKNKKSKITLGEGIRIITKSEKLRAWAIPLEALCIIVSLLFVGAGIYVADYYCATDTAEAAMLWGKSRGSYTVFDGGGDTGFVFYPGGKVEHSAYAPLMKSLAARGITCVLVEMPFRLAILDVNSYKNAVKKAPDVKNWYIGGHSLGGSAATMAVNGSDGFFNGAVLLAAYPTEKMDVPVLSVTASLDGVMNREKYNEGKAFWAEGSTELEIVGGNHAGFGSYGFQKGDNVATISPQEQLAQAADAIVSFVK